MLVKNIQIRETFKEDKRIDSAFMNKQTRDMLNIELGDQVYLKGTKGSFSLNVESNRKCNNNSIHINKKLRNNLGKLIDARKPSFWRKKWLSFKNNITGYSISFIIGILAGLFVNYIWSIVFSR